MSTIQEEVTELACSYVHILSADERVGELCKRVENELGVSEQGSNEGIYLQELTTIKILARVIDILHFVGEPNKHR